MTGGGVDGRNGERKTWSRQGFRTPPLHRTLTARVPVYGLHCVSLRSSSWYVQIARYTRCAPAEVVRILEADADQGTTGRLSRITRRRRIGRAIGFGWPTVLPATLHLTV